MVKMENLSLFKLSKLITKSILAFENT